MKKIYVVICKNEKEKNVLAFKARKNAEKEAEELDKQFDGTTHRVQEMRVSDSFSEYKSQ